MVPVIRIFDLHLNGHAALGGRSYEFIIIVRSGFSLRSDVGCAHAGLAPHRFGRWIAGVRHARAQCTGFSRFEFACHAGDCLRFNRNNASGDTFARGRRIINIECSAGFAIPITECDGESR